jgi:HEAT repeat protein
MVNLHRTVPQTPLDTLRVLLAEFSPEDTSFAGKLTHLVQTYRKQLFRELGGRLIQTTAPKGLRRAILSLIPKFDWPEWTPFVLQALQQEADLGVFDEGCAALGVIATREAYEALKQLQTLRNDPDRQVILTRELSQFQPQQSAGYYLSRLLEGQGNAKLSTQGAKILAVCAEPGDLASLVDAHRNEDPLIQRLAMRVIASLKAAEATQYLLDLLEQTRLEYLELQQIVEVQRRTLTLARGSAKPEFLRLVLERFQDRVPDISDCLERANSEENPEAGSELEPLRTEAKGQFDRFLLECLALLVEGKFARYSAYQSETADSAEVRVPQLNVLCDQAAEALAYRVSCGTVSFPEICPALVEIFRVRLGSDGFIQAFLNLLPATETSILDELLADPDLARRQRYLNALGSREDDALVPFFLKAMQDPIVEVGTLAIHHLGKLTSSFPALIKLFESGQHDQVRLAIRVFGENRTRLAAEPLVEFIQKDSRDDVLVEAVEALANIRYPAGTPIVLEMLHDGKPFNLQLALAKVLGLMGTAEASIGLLQKSLALKQPQVLILALEGALHAFPAFDTPLPVEHVPALMHLAERCFDEREGEGQRLRAMLAMQGFYAFDKGSYEKLKDQFSDFLFHMRTKENWDRENNDKVAAVIKELGRRSASLGLIAKKEVQIKGYLQTLPAKGPKRVEALLALRESLQDPELIIRPELARELADFVRKELSNKNAEWREIAHLCEIGGITHQEDLIEPIRGVFQRATGLGLKSAARTALFSLGLSEADLNRRAPIQSILVIEPSAFFRKRLVSSLSATGLWKLHEAGNRHEASEIVAQEPVDLILTESQDADGEMSSWLESLWEQQRFRLVLLSTSNRDLGNLADVPWLLGILFKPYPTEQLLRALES